MVERIDFDLLFRWFVGLGVDDPVWDATTFTKNRDRLLAGDVAARFLATVLAQPRVRTLLSTEHFSVDGTLLEAWASTKSFRPKDGSGPPPDAGRNGEQDFRGQMVRNMMLECVERRFDAVRAPQPVQWLADNGSAYTAAETVDFATALNLVACFTPVRSPESNGVCEAFVKTFKRAYVRVSPRPDAISVLQQLPAWFEDYNAVHPHSGLRMLSPREFIAQQSATPAACPV